MFVATVEVLTKLVIRVPRDSNSHCSTATKGKYK